MGHAGDFAPTATKVVAASVHREDADALAVSVDEGVGDYAGGLCIVCFDADRSAILAPCGHVAMCRWVSFACKTTCTAARMHKGLAGYMSSATPPAIHVSWHHA